MTFENLRQTLIQRLRILLHNGLFTERQLAFHLGISQPHLHHILAGKRTISWEYADRVLAKMSWSIHDLIPEPVAEQGDFPQPNAS